ncbi:MAG: AsnC family transcriptional regulator, partial [Candidatus Bathyarchaeia archaeon]
MQKRFDLLDVKILESLGIHGPRNITNLARKLGVPAETVRKRLKRIHSRYFLRTNVNIYHTNLGLKKAVVLAEAVPGYEDLLFESLKINNFLIYLSRCYGMNEGCLGIYTIPRNHCTDFKQFLSELERLEVARKIDLYWSTCFQSVNLKCNWFDSASKSWSFLWDKWVEEIPTKTTRLPFTLVDPPDFPVEGDETDVLILKELEKDATVSFTKLAKMLGISPQLVRYHFYEHLVKRNLIEGFQIGVFPFDRAVSDMFHFIFKFDNGEKLAKFALSLMDKPFVYTLGKILEEHALIANLYMPKAEFREFIDILSRLVKSGFLQSYLYVIQDLNKTLRQTISYDYFKDRGWIYEHEKHIKSLQ